MLTLYTSPGSGGFAAEVVLLEAAAKHEVVYIDTAHGEHRSEKFLKMNPLGQVPVLQLGPGRFMTESAAIVMYLADKYAPGKLSPLQGSPMRPEYLRWLTYMAVNVYGADLRNYYADRFSTDASAADGIRQAAVRDMNRYFKIIDEAIGPGRHMLGKNYSACDPYLVMLAHWHPDVPGLMQTCPNVARVSGIFKNRSAARQANEVNRLWA